MNSAFGFHLRLFTCAPYTSWTNYRQKEEITGQLNKLHNAELQALYSTPDIIRNLGSRRRDVDGQDIKHAWSLGWSRRRWEDNIKMDFRDVDCGPRDWIDLVEDRDQCGLL